MGKNSRKREIGVEVVAKVQSGRTAREARRGEVAEECGLQVKTVYNWLASTARSTGVNVNEISRLKRENEHRESLLEQQRAQAQLTTYQQVMSLPLQSLRG